MIGVDWGTSNCRAYRLDASGVIADRRSFARGILQIEGGAFEAALRDMVGDWLSLGEDRILLSGMIGSRQGWREAAYLPCPAGGDELAAGLTEIPFDGARVEIVPGLSATDESGIAEVMRGEETQIAGLLRDGTTDALVCLPGSHSKWVRLERGRIAGFATHMTGEAFAALRDHTILGRTMRDGPHDPAAFDAGIARAGDPGGLLHHLFGTRTGVLMGQRTEDASASYLSGMLIGHEVRAALPTDAMVHLIGEDRLTALYARAITLCGGVPVAAAADAAARGFAFIAGPAGK